jgi:phosphate starvation-inducible PhoH-like protein
LGSKGSYPRGNFKEVSFSVQYLEIMQLLAGATDENLRIIERELEVEIGKTPLELTVKGQDAAVDLAVDVLRQFAEVLGLGEQIFPGDIERGIAMLSANRKVRLTEMLRESVRIAGKKASISPKTVNQRQYIEAIGNNDIVFGIGPAGTGKTYLAMATAVAALLRKDVKRIILARPAVEAGERLGFLPGDMAEKVNPYLRPLYDALYDMVDPDKAQELIEKGTIEVAPLAFMRGRTLRSAFVILDEAQNTTSMQMKMCLTRLGFNSKYIITGDPTQVDLPSGVRSGLQEAVTLLEGVSGISVVRFGTEDVIRHPLVARIVHAYEKMTSH